MIVFIGWGSLVWDPRALPIRNSWYDDGPQVRVELLRQSNNGRLTFVLADFVDPVPSLWAIFNGNEELAARRALCEREGILPRDIERGTGFWASGDATPPCFIDLDVWAIERDVAAVFWTALPPKFNGMAGRAPSVDEAIAYLDALTGPTRGLAESYIRRAPGQIDTSYRRTIAANLGWLPSRDEI